MHEMVQVIVWFAVVTVVGWFLTAGLDLFMGVQLAPADGELISAIVRATHKVMYMAWGGVFVWLWHVIFSR